MKKSSTASSTLSPTRRARPERPTLTKVQQLEARARDAYRLALASLHLPYGRETLEANASSHELRALRIEKELARHTGSRRPAKPASGAPPETNDAARTTDIDDDTSGADAKEAHAEAGDTKPRTPLTVATLLQRAADLLGPHAALATLQRLERGLLRTYERLDLAELPPKTRLFIEAELYVEQLRAEARITSVKDSYR